MTCFVFRRQSKDIFFTKKTFLRKKDCGGLNKTRKEGFLTALATVIKKDPSTSIKKKSAKKL